LREVATADPISFEVSNARVGRCLEPYSAAGNEILNVVLWPGPGTLV
jgi:hypothetical protein